jgi:tRNA(Arg) A34 adenosine deaminase TadA
MDPDHSFLARSLELAHLGSTRGEGGPFGAVIVYRGEIIGEGWNSVVSGCDPTAHAEINAIRNASKNLGRFLLDGCTLYASSEPCPMCLSAAYWAKISRIVFANSRAEAAAIGFRDDDLYLELARENNQRSMLIEHLSLPDALNPMREWVSNPARVQY